jgi:hypothetical protein
MKCNKILGKWCKNKHGASKIIDTLETYQRVWIWDKMYTHVRVRVRVVDKILEHKCRFG